MLGNFQVVSWVSGLGRGGGCFYLVSVHFGFTLLHLDCEGGDLCSVALYPTQSLQSTATGLLGTGFSMNVCGK